MYRKMFSSTTIASSITMPTASVNASSVMLFSVKSIARISVKVAMIEAGIASAEISTARTFRMKNITTSDGEQAAPEQMLFERRDRRVDEPRVVACSRSACTPRGSVWRTGASFCLTASMTLMVFSPEARRMSSCTAGTAVGA